MNKTGNFNAEILDVNFIEHRYQRENPEQLELKIDFKTEDEQGVVYMDLSSVKYIETGKYAGQRACDVSNETLKKVFNIDLNINPQDLVKAKGQTVGVWGKEGNNGTVYYYLSVSQEVKKSPKEAMSILKDIFRSPAPVQPKKEVSPVNNKATEASSDLSDWL